MNITCRDDTKVDISLVDTNGTKRTLSSEEFEFICKRAITRFESGHVSRRIPFILKKGLEKIDFGYFYLLSKYMAKYALSNNRSVENRALREKIFKDLPECKLPNWLREFELDLIEVKTKNKRILLRKPKGDDPYQDLFWCTIREMFIRNQYDLNGKNITGKVVLDCGANVGVFSLMAAVFGAKKIYAFEPVRGTYDMLVDNINLNRLQGCIIPINKGVGEKNFSTNISYDATTDVLASINPNPILLDKQKIEVVKIDDYFKGKRIDFIKMDIEGYEEQALIGASKTIAKCKPVLSISAYHKPTDKTRLPEIIMKIRNDYKITLNSYGEPDFYCD